MNCPECKKEIRNARPIPSMAYKFFFQDRKIQRYVNGVTTYVLSGSRLYEYLIDHSDWNNGGKIPSDTIEGIDANKKWIQQEVNFEIDCTNNDDKLIELEFHNKLKVAITDLWLVIKNDIFKDAGILSPIFNDWESLDLRLHGMQGQLFTVHCDYDNPEKFALYFFGCWKIKKYNSEK
jgi:hypothetical protein